jgi:C4-dicarboxylate-specific signal transduction histidine kinase
VYPHLIGTMIGQLTNMSSYGSFVNEFLNSNKETQAQETDAILNGNHQYFMTTCGRLEDGAVIIINIPINELVTARKDLREKEAIAQYSSKLASLGQMAAGVAHEVNNPLAIIQGSASIIGGLVKEENVDRENLKIFSDRIISTTDRIAQIVRSLRTLSRGGEKDPFSPLSLQKVIASCIDISNHNLKQNDVKLIIPEGKKDLTVMGREVQLGQVLLNLLSNAIDAVKDLPERWVSVDFGHIDGNVWIEVIDSGKGIPQEISEKMMDPFFTTKPKEEGTGLGLSISSKIIEEHAGRLNYEKGRPNTTFRLTFPSPKI